MSAMAKELQRQIDSPKTYAGLGFEERLALMVDAEWSRRQTNKVDRNIRLAHFSNPSASVEGIEYHEDRKLDRAAILRYASGGYIQDGHHIIIKGASGNGKTYIACALGISACRMNKTVRYIRLPELLDELALARAEGTFRDAIKAYNKVDLLILDEWLIRCLSPDEAYNLLEIVEARCTRSSTIFCTQYDEKGWYARINPDPKNDSPISEAIIDRIIHNSYYIFVDGKISMRERHGLRVGERGVN